MANILTKAVAGLLEQMLTAGTVTGIRVWQPATLYELDVHLPTVDMDKWNTIKRVKCKVDDWAYRDYTPANWNAATRSCTLFIECGHDGPGSRWVRQLRVGAELLLGVAHAAPLPSKPGKILCLADGSALAHCLALKQLIDPEQYPIEAAILLHDDYLVPVSLTKNHPEFNMLKASHAPGLDVLSTWMSKRVLDTYSSVYLAGNITMVTGLRKKLKSRPDCDARIYAHGFWS